VPRVQTNALLVLDKGVAGTTVNLAQEGSQVHMEIQHTAKRAPHAIAIPNLVELQLDSFRWFVEEGLNELFLFSHL
jgi:DNA-directed RNA polymerase beta subunit